MRIEVLLELSVRELVPIFKFAVVRTPDLNCVVRQVDKAILDIFDVVLTTGRPEVAIGVKVPLQVVVDRCGQSVKPDVELTILVQERALAVFLDYVGALLSVHDVVTYDGLYLREVLAYCYAAATVRIFAWLDDPEVFTHGGELFKVRVLVWLVVAFFELLEFSVSQPLLDVVSQRHHLKRVLVRCLVVNAHIVVNRFFVRQVKVVLLMVRGAKTVGCHVFFLWLLGSVLVAFARSYTT